MKDKSIKIDKKLYKKVNNKVRYQVCNKINEQVFNKVDDQIFSLLSPLRGINVQIYRRMVIDKWL